MTPSYETWLIDQGHYDSATDPLPDAWLYHPDGYLSPLYRGFVIAPTPDPMNLSSGSFPEQYDHLPRGPFDSYARTGQQDEQDSGGIDRLTDSGTNILLILGRDIWDILQSGLRLRDGTYFPPEFFQAGHQDLYIDASLAAELKRIEDELAEPEFVRELAQLAMDCYNVDKPPLSVWAECKGWRVVDAERDRETGFRTVLYENVKTGQFVIACAGTSEGVDWVNNFQQALGLRSRQYWQAFEFIEKHQAKAGLILVGHSLGGGNASAGALIYTLPAVTFNAAGVNPRTVERKRKGAFDLNNAELMITAFRVRGEPLSTIQDADKDYEVRWTLRGMSYLWPGLKLPATLLLAIMKAAPNGIGRTVWIDGYKSPLDPIGRHGMGEVINGIDRIINPLSEKRAELLAQLEAQHKRVNSRGAK